MAHFYDERESFDNTLETLANLLYLVRREEPGSLQQHLYLEMADDMVKREVERRRSGT